MTWERTDRGTWEHDGSDTYAGLPGFVGGGCGCGGPHDGHDCPYAAWPTPQAAALADGEHGGPPWQPTPLAAMEAEAAAGLGGLPPCRTCGGPGDGTCCGPTCDPGGGW